jgi:hypothetical protein
VLKPALLRKGRRSWHVAQSASACWLCVIPFYDPTKPAARNPRRIGQSRPPRTTDRAVLRVTPNRESFSEERPQVSIPLTQLTQEFLCESFPEPKPQAVAAVELRQGDSSRRLLNLWSSVESRILNKPERNRSRRLYSKAAKVFSYECEKAKMVRAHLPAISFLTVGFTLETRFCSMH